MNVFMVNHLHPLIRAQVLIKVLFEIPETLQLKAGIGCKKQSFTQSFKIKIRFFFKKVMVTQHGAGSVCVVRM